MRQAILVMSVEFGNGFSQPRQEKVWVIAETALPAILAELIDQCGDDEQAAGIRAGSFHLEFPETADGERGETEPMDWPS
jgi:hypothetical protein